MKIALLQCNTVTGDVAGNAERILAAVREAAAQGADLCVTPELALCGVAPGSYLRAEDFAEGCKAGLQMLADALQDGPPLLVGAPVASVYASGLLSNAAILVQKGRWSVVSRKVYQTYTPAMCAGTARLAELADVITPNLTEAALLLDCPYDALPAGEAGCREIVERLSLEGRRSVVLTGASGEPGTTGAVCFDAATGRTGAVLTERVPREFHGTGDVFASVLTGALVQGADLFAAARRAVEFVRVCGERTAAQGLPMREGVDFEPLLGLLVPQDGGEPPLPHTGM